MLLNSSPCVHLIPDPCPQDSGTPITKASRDCLSLPLASPSAGSQTSALQSAASLTLQPAIHCQKVVDIFHSLLPPPYFSDAFVSMDFFFFYSLMVTGAWQREVAGKQQVEKYLFNPKGNSFLKGYHHIWPMIEAE